MRRWQGWAAACGTALVVLSGPITATAAGCDEYNPASPAAMARITLGAHEMTDPSGTELRSFIATDSIGRVDVQVVSANPRSAIRAVSAVPQVSRISPSFGEQMKGIVVSVSLSPDRRPASVVLQVRQVCARYFRNTFLYN